VAKADLRLRDRFRAGLLHLSLSALVAASIFALVRAVWFPGVLFEGAGGRELFFLITGVDVALGPLLTTLVFDRRKKALMFDLAVIGALQLSALGYGVSVLAEARPAFIAFTKDRFDLVRANDVSDEAYAQASDERYRHAPLTGPFLVGVRLPTDPDEAFDITMSALAGRDVQDYPKYYIPYDTVREAVKAHGQPIAELRALNPGRDREIDGLLEGIGRAESDVRFVPMRSGKSDLTVFVDARDGSVLRMALLRPWKY
jgi:hypothetical protein